MKKIVLALSLIMLTTATASIAQDKACCKKKEACTKNSACCKDKKNCTKSCEKKDAKATDKKTN